MKYLVGWGKKQKA